MTVSSDALQAIRSQLETITVANGYANTVSMVGIGRNALAVGSKSTLPTITLTALGDAPTDGTNIEAGQWCQQWTRTIAMETFVSAADGWEIALDAVIDDERRCLANYRGPLTIGSINFVPPSDGGDTASAVMLLTYSYVTNYTR